MSNLVEKIHSLLPQTQCEKCLHPGCKPYAKAIVNEDEATHLCQPGGKETYEKIQKLLGRTSETEALNIIAHYPEHHKLTIDNDQCIGCTKCIPACPVDAIIGSPKAMHHIIDELCTGCDLCLTTCPVDCIKPIDAIALPDPEFLMLQYNRHEARKENDSTKLNQSINKAVKQIETGSMNVIQAALTRAKEKKQPL